MNIFKRDLKVGEIVLVDDIACRVLAGEGMLGSEAGSKIAVEPIDPEDGDEFVTNANWIAAACGGVSENVARIVGRYQRTLAEMGAVATADDFNLLCQTILIYLGNGFMDTQDLTDRIMEGVY